TTFGRMAAAGAAYDYRIARVAVHLYSIVPGPNTPADVVALASVLLSIVAVLPGATGARDESAVWLWTEFWNDAVSRAYQLADRPNSTSFPTDPLRLDGRTGRLLTPHERDYVVVSPADPTLRIRGAVVSRSAYGPVVIRPDHPYRAERAIE